MAEKMLTEIVHVYSQTRFQSKMLSFMKAWIANWFLPISYKKFEKTVTNAPMLLVKCPVLGKGAKYIQKDLLLYLLKNII